MAIYTHETGMVWKRVKGMLETIMVGLKKKADRFFYSCEYIKECTKVTPQCAEGGNSYCGIYKKRLQNKNSR